LLDLLDAEKAYRDTRLAYLNLIGSHLTAAAQMNMAARQGGSPMNRSSLQKTAHNAMRRARFSGSQDGRRRVLCALIVATLCMGLSLLVTGCARQVTAQQSGGAGTGPTPAVVEPDQDANSFKVDHPDRFLWRRRVSMSRRRS
jgi:hypothetical protein